VYVNLRLLTCVDLLRNGSLFSNMICDFVGSWHRSKLPILLVSHGIYALQLSGVNVAQDDVRSLNTARIDVPLSLPILKPMTHSREKVAQLSPVADRNCALLQVML